MAEDPFVSSSTQQPHIYRPIPRRNFSNQRETSDSPAHAFVPSTPPGVAETQNRPSDFLAQLNARLLRTYNAGLTESGDAEEAPPPPQRNKSFMNLTKSTLFGIYDDDASTPVEQSVPETPWGAGAETPGRKYSGSRRWESGTDSPAFGLTMQPRTSTGNATARHALRPQRRGIWKYAVSLGKLAALFLFGVTYGVIVSHLHDTRELAAVRVEGVDPGNWVYLASWGLAGLVLGSCLPYVEVVWGGQGAEKENETSFSEQWNDIVRSVGAFLAIAFAIRRLPWQSTLQLTLTLALVNPALWYILDRTKPGFSYSLLVTSVLTSCIFLSDLDILPSPSLPATTNGTHTPSAAGIQGEQNMFVGVVSYETLAVVTWVGSVLFCSCVCFGSIGRRLAVWDHNKWGRKREP
ncbi:hypothetical protein BU23DRAFT_553757 [Bimuria novae-zelandiae CBS 107.79]|uniref:INSIG domain-containing protein n=1 Tax=Bimuria novae-zelandiae CBS 107.79 TaxID=1447943 RepID=A0A6A5VAF1_9PLEO|nr:hypothetical protein BU23DRAFT_553757 [Bimuria novae-zelandiae CBS 107.79]